MKVQRKSKFTGLRKKHPGVILGHQCCQGDGSLVPENMGWLWNVGTYGLPNIRRGWRPGAVKKSVAKIMKIYLTPPAEPAPCVKPKDPSTLRVQKNDGEYVIVMNPLGIDAELIQNSSPIVFKIAKSEEEKKILQARKLLRERGIVKTCDCPSLESCNCLNDCEKNRLSCELAKVSKELCLKLSICDLKDSSDSEVDVEFTPPSAVKLKKRKPVKVSYEGTQYEIQEEIPFDESIAVEGSKLKKTLIKNGKSLIIEDKTGKSFKVLDKSGKPKDANDKSEKSVIVHDKLGKSVITSKSGKSVKTVGKQGTDLKVKDGITRSRNKKQRAETAATGDGSK